MPPLVGGFSFSMSQAEVRTLIGEEASHERSTKSITMSFLRHILIAVVLTLTSGMVVVAQPTSVVSAAHLTGTRWQGFEEKSTSSTLAIEFGTENSVVMNGAKDTLHGKFDLDGDTLSLSFGDGNIVYTGKIKGDRITGEAMDTSFKPWKFSVTRQGPLVHLPRKGAKVASTAPRTTMPVTVAKLTPERLPEFLRKMGYKVEVVERKIGGPMCLVTLSKEGWTFEVEVTVQAGGVIWLTAPLVEMSREKIAAGKLLDILEANGSMGPCFFAYRSADSHLCMRLEVAGAGEDHFRGDLNLFIDQIRTAHPLWRDDASK